jgi:hypothetical protein
MKDPNGKKPSKKSESVGLSFTVAGVEAAVQPAKNLEAQIDDALTKKLIKIGSWVLSGGVGVVATWLFSTIWQMNEKIHNIIGQEVVRGELQSLLQKKVEYLEAENASLRSRNEWMSTNIVSRKDLK